MFGLILGVPLKLPGCQVYILAPVAVKVAVLPMQIASGLVLMFGNVFTTTVTVAVLLQPLALLAVTV